MFIRLLFRTSTTLLLASLLACGGSGGGRGTPTGTSTAITLTPASRTLAPGATTYLTATGTYSDGSTGNVSTLVTWLSSNRAVATMANGGAATGGSEPRLGASRTDAGCCSR